MPVLWPLVSPPTRNVESSQSIALATDVAFAFGKSRVPTTTDVDIAKVVAMRVIARLTRGGACVIARLRTGIRTRLGTGGAVRVVRSTPDRARERLWV